LLTILNKTAQSKQLPYLAVSCHLCGGGEAAKIKKIARKMNP
jgi:hypothetical protein